MLAIVGMLMEKKYHERSHRIEKKGQDQSNKIETT